MANEQKNKIGFFSIAFQSLTKKEFIPLCFFHSAHSVRSAPVLLYHHPAGGTVLKIYLSTI